MCVWKAHPSSHFCSFRYSNSVHPEKHSNQFSGRSLYPLDSTFSHVFYTFYSQFSLIDFGNDEWRRSRLNVRRYCVMCLISRGLQMLLLDGSTVYKGMPAYLIVAIYDMHNTIVKAEPTLYEKSIPCYEEERPVQLLLFNGKWQSKFNRTILFCDLFTLNLSVRKRILKSLVVVVCFCGFNVAFNNYSVISRRCLVPTGSSMLTFIVLPHWSIMLDTKSWLDIIPRPLTLSWHWVDQS